MSDEGEALVELPFALRYFTTDLAAGAPITISANGWLGMTGEFFGGRSVFIPSTSVPNGIIAVHAGDQETTMPICVATLGTAPRRQWVVEWSGTVERTSLSIIAGTALTYESVITEDTGTIDLLYERVVGTPSSRYHGLESSAGTGVPGACATPTTYLCAMTAGTRVRFTPAP
jgi:hypothetical protein